ncbi:MAG: hypothetical protein ACYSWO_27260 [Planctomycetota bacterium]|jgi:hypothetical protein
MRARLWSRNTDYETLLNWWKGHGCGDDYVVPSYRLPPSGWVVEDDDGNPVCITWLYYFQHTAGALLGNVVSNPDADTNTRSAALDLLILRVTTEADRNNCDIIFGMTTREGYLRKLKKHGFTQQSKHSVEFQRERGVPDV